jgi:biotin synthase
MGMGYGRRIRYQTTGSRHPNMGQMEPRPALTPGRSDWSVDELVAIYETPLLDLIDHASRVHRQYHDPREIQRAALFSIKTGGCPEDCAYCPQSAHHVEVKLTRERIMEPATVIAAAAEAKATGASRFCMGAAWREARDGAEFDAVLEMVRGVSAIGMESCVTLGMLRPDQARRLAEAGLTAYNHNLDTSPEFYSKIIGTRSYQDRLETLGVVRAAGIKLCCGGIIGMGESVRDRAGLIQVLASQTPHPESVPINALVPVPGTPMAARPPVEPLELVRMVATARIAMPGSQVRLSAGRRNLTPEAQILCFLVGANSIFSGEKLLTTPNAEDDGDVALLRAVGAHP